MSTAIARLSVPEPRKAPPRPITESERAQLTVLADALCGPSANLPAPSQTPGFNDALDLALATRSDVFDEVMATSDESRGADDLLGWARRLSETDAARFWNIAGVLAGAYLMTPPIRDAIAYPGQHRDVPRLEEAMEQIMDGILDPVIARGPIYLAPPAE